MPRQSHAKPPKPVIFVPYIVPGVGLVLKFPKNMGTKHTNRYRNQEVKGYREGVSKT
jgi:hypothetical protein